MAVTQQEIQNIVDDARANGLDPLALLAVANQEGLGGGIGDNNTSFGPFQLHYGGAYPATAPHSSPQASQAWAWSPAGIQYAINSIASVARGQTGPTAISSTVTGFERPANPQAEISGALNTYDSLKGLGSPLIGPGGQLQTGALGVIESAGTGSAADKGSTDITGSGGGPSVLGGVLGPIHTVEDLIRFVTSWRFAEIVGGSLLLLVGLILVGRSLGISAPQTPASKLADYAERQPTSREAPTRMQSHTLEVDKPRPKPVRPADYGEVPF
jgi:hypothetical protein